MNELIPAVKGKNLILAVSLEKLEALVATTVQQGVELRRVFDIFELRDEARAAQIRRYYRSRLAEKSRRNKRYLEQNPILNAQDYDMEGAVGFDSESGNFSSAGTSRDDDSGESLSSPSSAHGSNTMEEAEGPRQTG